MDPSHDADIHRIVDSLTRRAAARGLPHLNFLGSVRELVGTGEPDTAIDWLINGVNAFRLPMRHAEYARLLAIAELLDGPDSVTDIDPDLLIEDTDDA
ncbi:MULTISPECIES: hypothetical protein [unclassified Streptomyces]|uniref:hypothetical protein n=1 Tax=unclassified Streptomyces TaxID=2593676 RepID=UPI002E2E1C12|nr:hypothetical protein [Streptomyces sp. NBC_00223]